MKTLIWINGPFGGGKTTTAEILAGDITDGRLYDPEEVGTMVRRIVPEQEGDWQHNPIWRPLVADTAHRLHDAFGGPLLAPMTLLHQPYATEIFDLLHVHGFTVHHIVLTCDPTVLRARIDAHVHFPDDLARSEKIRQWRLGKIEAYEAALTWLHDCGHLIDTTDRTPRDVADHILKATGLR